MLQIQCFNELFNIFVYRIIQIRISVNNIFNPRWAMTSNCRNEIFQFSY